MKLLSLAIASLGVWVLLNSFLRTAIWDDIVFGAVTAVLGIIAAFTIKSE